MHKTLKQFVKFSGSSLMTSAVDFSCFSLLYLATSKIIVSNVCARVISATFNFTVNRKVIFKKNEEVKKTALEYFASVAAFLAVKTVILKIAVDYFGLNAFLSKGFIGLAFFLVNWTVQKFIIFAKPKYKST